MEILREITPLTQNDCYTIFTREKTDFDFPLHYHEEYELNMIINAGGAQRVVGDHIEEIGDLELVLVGPNLPHVWYTHHCKDKIIKETTLQFHKDMLDEKLLQRNQLSHIRNMFKLAQQGILFSNPTTYKIKQSIDALANTNGFDSFLNLLSILHDLSIARDKRILSSAPVTNNYNNFNSRRIEKLNIYLNKNYHKNVTLAEISKLVGMPEASTSRFIKMHTGRTFVENLNEIRLGYATRLLISTTQTIAEIAYSCGFNNVTYFNRIFKKAKNYTPKEFRDNYSENRVFI
ncbi:AraC family transcriptional regulator [Rhizosphaericola mali]|uniref:Helix-turn-helix transcriptional regulator n=1 Tax=Rhizosphaericola mali TaxID=2545455 RepID=A0A5P2G9F1_9BACT|nr:AraC family transcriptional regulator [Rhizosphaericola mali]QES89843.1 helix-turn-helix transcriptional regulator [Rhizosphaericola mali]